MILGLGSQVTKGIVPLIVTAIHLHFCHLSLKRREVLIVLPYYVLLQHHQPSTSTIVQVAQFKNQDQIMRMAWQDGRERFPCVCAYVHPRVLSLCYGRDRLLCVCKRPTTPYAIADIGPVLSMWCWLLASPLHREIKTHVVVTCRVLLLWHHSHGGIGDVEWFPTPELLAGAQHNRKLLYCVLVGTECSK